MEIFDTGIPDLVDTIARAGGTPILVGGAVRDFLMAGKTHPFEGETDFNTTDYDIECFGLTLPEIRSALFSKKYQWDEVGEHFSVLKVRIRGLGHPVDLSIPRYEKSSGSGHREFEVMTDPNLTFAEAARRRDFGMNAIGFNLLDGTLLDPYGGVKDIELDLIRHVSDAFAEDPLRPLRAARFAARFTMVISTSTIGLCREMRPLAPSLPAERIWMEIEKAVHECPYLGDFFWWIARMGWIDLLPEVSFLQDVPQDPDWHPEGDVFMHTCHALNYWSQNLRTGNKEDDLVTAIAILCHDFGKATTTEWSEEKQHITAYGHEEAGAEPTRTFLHRLRQYELAKEVVPLVENHLAPVYSAPTPKSIRRLSVKVKRLDLLANLSRADQAGRPPKNYTDGFRQIDWFETAVKDLAIPRGGPKPLVGGDYLTSIGCTPGPDYKVVLGWVYQWQLDGDITTEEQAQSAALEIARYKGMI